MIRLRQKPIFFDNFGDVTPPKIEANSNIDGAFVHVEVSLYDDSSVIPLDANEVDTTEFFSEEVKWKDRDDLVNWVLHQANRMEFTIVIRRSPSCVLA